MLLHRLHYADGSARGDESALRTHPVFVAFVHYQIIVLLVSAHLDDGSRYEPELACVAVSYDIRSVPFLAEGLAKAGYLKVEAVVLLRQVLVLPFQGEVVPDGLAASPQGVHHAVGETGDPYILQFPSVDYHT